MVDGPEASEVQVGESRGPAGFPLEAAEPPWGKRL